MEKEPKTKARPRGRKDGTIDRRTPGSRKFKRLLDSADDPEAQIKMLRERVAGLQIIWDGTSTLKHEASSVMWPSLNTRVPQDNSRAASND